MKADPAELRWLREQLGRYTYRPNWTFSIADDTLEGPRLIISMEVEDSRRPGHWITVLSTNTLPMGHIFDMGDGWFDRFIEACISTLEDHERREWLRRDGQLVNDPHAGGR